MKIKLFTALFTFVTVFANGQQYHPMLDSTEWYVGSNCPFVGYSSQWYKLLNDTIINGNSYKQYNPTYSTARYCVREDIAQKKVWINNNSQDDLLYDFNLSVGDTFTYMQVKFVFVIKDSINTCSGQRKRMKFCPVPGQFSQPDSFTCIEGVGSLFNPFDLFFRGYPYDQCQYFLICCHQKDTVNFISPTDSIIPCPQICLTAVGINEFNPKISISVYPNPFSSTTTLQTDNFFHNATLTVDNCFGQTVKQIKNINGQTVTFYRDNLASGLYFVRLTEENKIIAVDKLVITDK